MRAGAGIARRVGNRCRDGHAAVAEAENHARRDAHAPVARRVQHGGVRLAADGDGHLIARCRAGGGAADDVRLAVFCEVNDIVARHGVDGHRRNGVDGHRRNGDVHRQVVINRCRVARLVADACGHGHAAVRQGRNIGRRDVQRPAAVRADGGGVVFAIQRHGHRLARFGRAAAGHGQIALRFGGIKNVVRRQGVDRDGRRGGIHAVLAARRGAVAVHVGDAHLHAGVAVFQASQIRRRYGPGPVAAVVHRGGVDFAVQADGHGLPGFHVGGRTGQHQIRALLRRVDHVVGRNRIDADGNGRQIYRHLVADGNRVTR